MGLGLGEKLVVTDGLRVWEKEKLAVPVGEELREAVPLWDGEPLGLGDCVRVALGGEAVGETLGEPVADQLRDEVGVKEALWLWLAEGVRLGVGVGLPVGLTVWWGLGVPLRVVERLPVGAPVEERVWVTDAVLVRLPLLVLDRVTAAVRVREDNEGVQVCVVERLIEGVAVLGVRLPEADAEGLWLNVGLELALRVEDGVRLMVQLALAVRVGLTDWDGLGRGVPEAVPLQLGLTDGVGVWTADSEGVGLRV